MECQKGFERCSCVRGDPQTFDSMWHYLLEFYIDILYIFFYIVLTYIYIYSFLIYIYISYIYIYICCVKLRGWRGKIGI